MDTPAPASLTTLNARRHGRTSGRDDAINPAWEYVEGGWRDVAKNIVPSIAGLACWLGVSRETIYQWRKESDEFKQIHAAIQVLQEVLIIDGALAGTWNANFAKIMMAKHGYSDKSEIDHKSTDGSMTPKGSSLDEFYNVPAEPST